jgi:hypothetical protein
VNVFEDSKKHYIISSHAKRRIIQRGNSNFENAEKDCTELITNGQLLLETEVFRYVKNGNLFFPCKKEDDLENTYMVTTVLLFDRMVQNRFQKIVDMYDKPTN